MATSQKTKNKNKGGRDSTELMFTGRKVFKFVDVRESLTAKAPLGKPSRFSLKVFPNLHVLS